MLDLYFCKACPCPDEMNGAYTTERCDELLPCSTHFSIALIFYLLQELYQYLSPVFLLVLS